tara:strand:+ start:2137 stop:2766 length:630 start_codon:yes stop_codon:yes gene_type:complete
MIVYKNKYISITSLKNKYIFEIFEYLQYKTFFDTFLNNINVKDKNNFKITIYANEINTLEFLLNNNRITEIDCKHIFLFLLKQLKSLEKYNLTIPVYNLKDIIYFKIGDKYSYYFLNLSYIFDTDKSKNIIIKKLFIKNEFASNELQNLFEIPNTSILSTASYWSLAKIVECSLKSMDKTLLDVKYSKLYWALKKCLEKNPKHRYLIFI